jgi:hypothetical protein
MHGSKAVPQEWLAQLELRDVITELAEDLYAFPDWKIDMNEQKIWEKYPGF